METQTSSLISPIIKVLVLAGTYGGVVFGDYLRHLISAQGKLDALTWANPELWFRTRADADRFVAAAGTQLRVCSNAWRPKHSLHPTFPWRLFTIQEDDAAVTYLCVFMTAEFPVEDFDVNMLQGIIHHDGFITVSPGDLMLGTRAQFQAFQTYWRVRDVLRDKIIRKEAQILPSYVIKLAPPTLPGNEYHAHRVIERYFKQGWTVSLPDGTRLNPHATSAETLIQFVRQWVRTQSSQKQSDDPGAIRLPIGTMGSRPSKNNKPRVIPSKGRELVFLKKKNYYYFIGQTPGQSTPRGQPETTLNLPNPSVSSSSIPSSSAPPPSMPASSNKVPVESEGNKSLRSVTDAIERRHTQAILGLLQEMRRETLRDPSVPEAMVLEQFQPRVTAAVATTKQDLYDLVSFLQECHQFTTRFQAQSPEVRATVTPILLNEIQP